MAHRSGKVAKGLAADAAGNIYVATGNGTQDGVQAWGESVLRLSTQSGLNAVDYFTPAEWVIAQR